MGWAHDPSAFVPLYLPLDEEHPMMSFEPYGLSKQIGECLGEMVTRSTTISIVSLQFTNVVSPEQQAEFPLDAPTLEIPRTLVREMWLKHTFWGLKQTSLDTKHFCLPNRQHDSRNRQST